MDGKVSITITSDKPITVRITEDGGSKETEGMKRLLNEVKGGRNDVVKAQHHRKDTRG